MKPWLALLFLLMPGGSAQAQTNWVTPGQIVSDALAHSYPLRILDQQTAAAGARQDQARAQAWPRLSADATARRYTGLETSQFGPLFSIPAIENRYGVGVMLSQPAFTGGRIKAQKEGAAHSQRAAEQDRRGAAADVALDALAAYWVWAKSYHLARSLHAAVERTAAHARDVRNRQEAGLATDNEALASEVLLDQTRLRLEEAQRRFQVALARIRFLTGKPLVENSVPAEVPAGAVISLESEENLIGAALANRAELAARQLEVKTAEAAVKTTRADYFPQVSLVARYEQARPNLLNIPPQDRWQDDAFAGVALSWNIFDFGLTKAKVAEARVRAAQAKTRLGQTEEQIALEVREARINQQDAGERVVVARRAAQSAQRNLEAATDHWKNGLARHADVLDAHARLTDAQYDVTAARADLELARAALEHAVGQLQPVLRP